MLVSIDGDGVIGELTLWSPVQHAAWLPAQAWLIGTWTPMTAES